MSGTPRLQTSRRWNRPIHRSCEVLRDRKRDRVLQLHDYRVVRFTHSQIEKEPDAVIAAIRRLLGADFG